MILAAIIGLLAGLIAAGAAIFIALYALGYFNYLGGEKTSPNAVNKETLVKQLLSLNDAKKPYEIIRGDTTDLIAEWKIADATWYGVFNKNHFSKAYRANLLLDEARHSVRCFEEIGSVCWSVGTSGLMPSIRFNKSAFSGRILFNKSYGIQYGVKDPANPAVNKIYEYKFDIDEIREPIIRTVKEKGWEWVPVTARRHITRKQPLSSFSLGRGNHV